MILGISYVEWIGYIAMIFVASSFLMKKINTLRTVNSIGAAFFVLYGIMLGMSWPIIITNAFILSLNTYYLLFKKPAESTD